MFKRDKNPSSFAPRKLFREIKYEMGKALFFSTFLDATILFFALNAFFTFFSIPSVYAAIPGLIYLFWRLARTFSKKRIRKLERGNPEINEILRTAVQYKNTNSLLVQGLFLDLQKKLATVSAGVLLDPSKAVIKLLVIAFLAFSPVLIASYLPTLIQDNPFEDLSLVEYQFTFFGERDGAITELQGIELNESDDIFGEEDILALGSDKLTIAAETRAGSVDFTTTQDAEDTKFRYTDFPVDVEAEGAETAQGGAYSSSEVALINDYSCRSRGTCES